VVNAAAELPAWLTDARVRFGRTPRHLDHPTATGVLWQAKAGQFLIDVPGAARYLVGDGISITIEARPAAPPDHVARFLRTAPLAALLYQRGVLACHASAVETPRGALLIAAESGSGKSTLAAALLLRGCGLLADDVAPVELNGEGWPVVRPTSADLVLWPDARSQFFPDGLPDWIAPNGAADSCRHLVLTRWDPPAAVTLCGIIRLYSHPALRDHNQPATLAARFQGATRMAWNSRFAEPLLDRAAHLRISAAIARHIPVTDMVRSTVRWQAGELADRIMENYG
jgi:hypothetical protein